MAGTLSRIAGDHSGPNLADGNAVSEILISPLPKAEIFALNHERNALIAPYVRDCRSYYETRTSGDDVMERFKQVTQAIDGLYGPQLRRANEISERISAERSKVYVDLAGRFQEMMYRLRAASLVDAQRHDLGLAKEVIAASSDEDSARDTRFAGFGKRLESIVSAGKREPADGPAYVALECLGREIGEQMHALVPAVDHRDLADSGLAGKMYGNYFFGPEAFFKQFKWQATPDAPGTRIRVFGRGEIVSFEIFGGALKGTYALFANAEMGFKELAMDPSSEEYEQMRFISPARFSVELPLRYAPIARAAFTRIRKEYAGRIIDPMDVRLWRAGTIN
jgi:hypothetical protein